MSNDWITWRDGEWVPAVLANLELLEQAHEVMHSAPRHFEHVINTDTDAGRAVLLLLELEQLSRGMFASLAARRVAKRLHQALPYEFHADGMRYWQILSVEDAMRRGAWACGDTAAAAAAVFVRGKWPVFLCTETVDGLPQYAHVRLRVSGSVVEPWPEARRPEARGCTLLDDVSVLLRERRT